MLCQKNSSACTGAIHSKCCPRFISITSCFIFSPLSSLTHFSFFWRLDFAHLSGLLLFVGCSERLNFPNRKQPRRRARFVLFARLLDWIHPILQLWRGQTQTFFFFWLGVKEKSQKGAQSQHSPAESWCSYRTPLSSCISSSCMFLCCAKATHWGQGDGFSSLVLTNCCSLVSLQWNKESLKEPQTSITF